MPRTRLGRTALILSTFLTVQPSPRAAAADGSPAGETVRRGAPALRERDVINRLIVLPGLERAAQQAGEAARARSRATALWKNPQVQYQHEALVDTEAEDIVQLAQSFDLSGKRRLRRAAAERRGHAARALARLQRVDAVAEARLVYYRAVYRARRAEAADRWHQRLTTVADAVRRRVASGDAPRYESLRLTQQGRQAVAAVATERALHAAAMTRLGALVTGDIPLDARLSDPLLPAPTTDSPAGLRAAIAKRGDVVARRRTAAAAKLEKKAASRGWVPTLSLTGGYKTVARANVRDRGFVAGGTLTLPIFNHGQESTRAAEARQEHAEALTGVSSATALARARELVVRVDQLRTAALALEEGAAEDLEALVLAVEAAYRGGEVGVVALVDAFQAEADACMGVLDLQWRARQAAIALDRELGWTP